MGAYLTGDGERDALIGDVGRYCPCGVDLYRNGCYRCLKARGAVWYFDPHATCSACGAHITVEGHVCTAVLS